METFSIPNILSKLSHSDKDFRYMACSDLTEELKRDTFKLDAVNEGKVVDAILKLLEDSSGDVQGVAVKCLGPLVKKIGDANVTKIIAQLTMHMQNMKKSELREISNIGLKGVIQDIDDVLGEKVADMLVPRLVTGLKPDTPPEVVQDALDILADLLVRFGPVIVRSLEQLQRAVIPHLESARQVTKKRATQCLTYIAKSAPEPLFSELADTLIGQLKSTKSANKRTYVQALGSLARLVYHRMGKYIPTVSPLLREALGSANKEGDEDLKENVLQTFEAFVLRCPKDVSSAELDQIISLSLKLISFDPNFAGDEDDEGGSGGENEPSDEGSFGSDDEDDNVEEDDESWKVRRAAAKTLSAVILVHPELLATTLWKTVAPVIIKRFSEREDSVRLDVFATFNDLVRQTGHISKGAGQGALLEHLHKAIPLILKPLCAHLKDKSVKTRQGAVGVIREVSLVVPGCFNSHADLLVPGLLVSLGDKPVKNLQLKLETLALVRQLISHSAGGVAFAKHLDAFLPLVKEATTDQYFKVVSEALRVCAAIVTAAGETRADLVLKVYAAIKPQMLALDIDQAVKEAAIHATAVVVAALGSKMPELPDVLNLFKERLGNEITRSATVAAVGIIAERKVDIGPILVDTVKKLASYLRKANRALKTASISSLSALVRNYGDKPEFKGLHELIVEELSKIVSEADLHLSQLALNLTSRVLESDPASAKCVKEKLYPQVLLLVQSSLLQGQALDALTALYASLVKGHQSVFAFKELLDSLLGLANQKLVKQNYLSVGRCVSAIVLNASAADAQATVQRFIQGVTSGSDQHRLVSLYCLGDIGRKSDLSAHSDLRGVVSSLLESENEEIRAAASYALGSISVGNLSAFLPSILQEVQQSKRQYLLLHSIREIIIDAPAISLAPHLDTIMALLFQNSSSPDDGTRNVVAECLGKLAPVNPAKLIGALRSALDNKNADSRATIVSAFKFAINDHPVPGVEEALDGAMENVLGCLKDENVEVRRCTLRTLNYIVHNKSSLVRLRLSGYLAPLYDQAFIKKELIREVDLGPFKHRVDDGLENRKAAFECIYTLLEKLSDVISVSDLVQPLLSGLEDENEIKLQSYLIIVRLTAVSSSSILEVLDSLLEGIKKELKKKIDKTAIAQAQERQLELKRAALRSVVALGTVTGSESNAKYKEVVDSVIGAAGLKEQYDLILRQEQEQDDR